MSCNLRISMYMVDQGIVATKYKLIVHIKTALRPVLIILLKKSWKQHT